MSSDSGSVPEGPLEPAQPRLWWCPSPCPVGRGSEGGEASGGGGSGCAGGGVIAGGAGGEAAGGGDTGAPGGRGTRFGAARALGGGLERTIGAANLRAAGTPRIGFGGRATQAADDGTDGARLRVRP